MSNIPSKIKHPEKFRKPKSQRKQRKCRRFIRRVKKVVGQRGRGVRSDKGKKRGPRKHIIKTINHGFREINAADEISSDFASFDVIITSRTEAKSAMFTKQQREGRAIFLLSGISGILSYIQIWSYIKDHHERIVSRELWKTVQGRR